jgi:hypothetical protein
MAPGKYAAQTFEPPDRSGSIPLLAQSERSTTDGMNMLVKRYGEPEGAKV